MARPSYYLVKGVKTSTPGDIVCGKPKTENYEISLPILVQGASKAAQAEVLYSACYTPAGRPKKPIPGYDWPICPAPIETKKGGPRQ